MTDRIGNPQRTYALVVGIEQYALGPGAHLNGPAHDARSFADWLRARGVPPENIVLLLSPLESNRTLLEEWSGPSKGPATRQVASNAINHQLRQWSGDLLYVFWAGHGIITTTRSRRLFYADTTVLDWYNLVLESLLLHTASDIFPGFGKQIYLIDTCATYERSIPRELTGDEFQLGKPVAHREQFILFATKAFERARNLTQEQAGQFSKVVLEELVKEPNGQWPPQMEAVAERVKLRFETLRDAGKAKQTPISVQTQAWDGTKRFLVQSEEEVEERPQHRHNNRQVMIERVHKTWITGVLENSFHGAGLITLGLHEHPEALDNPWPDTVQDVVMPAHSLPIGTPIIQVYDDAGGGLLILGGPGAGKSTLLMELTRNLLDRARQDETFPIPAMFTLSSWDPSQQSITSWLVKELNSKYWVPRKLAQEWVESDQVLLLLDGLDEVEPKYREACVKAINAYRQEHGLRPTVVCTRSDTYFDLENRLQLTTAVIVQPLTLQQIDEYLLSAGEPPAAVRRALDEDPGIKELAATPLILSLLVRTSQGHPVVGLPTAGSQETRQQQVFKIYVERMLQRRIAGKQYSSRQIVRWLTWLAQQMTQHSQVEFYLERMQPDWFPKGWSRLFNIIVRLGIGLICGLICILLAGLAVNNLKFGVALGVVFGLVFALTSWVENDITPAEVIGWSWVTMWRQGVKVELRSALVRMLPVGLICALLGGFFLLLLSGGVTPRSTAHLSPLGTTLIIGIICGMLGMLLSGLFSGFASELSESMANARVLVTPRQGIWRAFRNSLPTGLPFGLVSGLVFGLLFEYLIGPVYGFFAGLLFGAVNGLLFGLTRPVKTKVKFTEVLSRLRMHLWRKGVKTGFINLLGVGLGMWLIVYILTYAPVSSLYAALLAIVVIRLLMGIISGLSSDTLDEQTFVSPNQGIWNSARNSAFVGLIFGIVGGLLVGLIFGLAFALQGNLSNTLTSLWLFIVIGCVVSGLAVGLPNGGIACIQHFILRFFLCCFGKTPWNYPRFLDHAVDHALLRKIGGGYIFIHQLLLEYFKSLDATADHHETAE